MNRLELVERVANKHGISKAEADRIVVTIFEEIMSSVTLGVPVTLIGFGTLRPWTAHRARAAIPRLEILFRFPLRVSLALSRVPTSRKS